MSRPELEIVSQFTEDAVASQDMNCQRPSCGKFIPKGDPCYYIATINPAKPGRLVCKSCLDWYSRKLATTVRTRAPLEQCESTNQVPSIPVEASSGTFRMPPNPKVIQQSVSAAQSGAAVNPPRVVALPPPPPKSLQSAIQSIIQRHAVEQAQVPRGPNVHIPSAWKNTHPEPPQNLYPAAPCYTPNHTLYASEHQRWARASYCSPPVETITLDISALHKGGPRRNRLHGTPFGSICEGKKDINAHITAPDLMAIALSTIIPKIHAFCPEFAWRYHEFVVRDSSWVDLSSHPDSNRPYFYHECLQPNSRKNAKLPLVFKSKQFSLYVVVPTAQWKDYLNYIEGIAEGALSSTVEPNTNTKELGAAQSSVAKVVTHSSPTSFTTSLAERLISRDVAQLTNTHDDSIFIHTGSHHDVDCTSLCDSTTDRPVLTMHDHHPVTFSPRNKPTPLPAPSPDRNQVIEALACGGSADVDMKKVLKIKLKTIINPVASHPGQLMFDSSLDSLLGVGGFKTAHAAQLVLTPPAPVGLGSLPRHDVVMKRPYYKPNDGAQTESRIRFNRYVLSQEAEKLFREANVLYWAKSLMQMTYQFIDHAVDTYPTPPPFDIPRLRFVEAGSVGVGLGSTRRVVLR
ncbi:hypothetical protein EV401DRAFT_2073755 [Pisolithus croceorrhizus]|nr:hypothetical protein EV401DRAFT_2073755 [Pisolithus croceorrhizus]